MDFHLNVSKKKEVKIETFEDTIKYHIQTGAFWAYCVQERNV